MLILLFITALPLFSQKLWEIEVNPNDLLRDVMEIPNSDLLLFTYNTGKLEIRNSQDGSLVKNVIVPNGELGSYNISGLGNSYYFSERAEFEPGNVEKMINDTIFVYDLFSDQIINRISFDIEGFDNKENIQTKKYRYSFTPDMTKLFGRIEYCYKQPVIEDFKLYYNKYYFYVYDIIQKKVIYHEKCHEEYFDEQGRRYSPGFALDSYRSSPDSKYIILNGRDLGDGYYDESKEAAKMFNVELNGMSLLKTNENTSNEILNVLENGKFQNENNITIASIDIFRIYSFPDLKLKTDVNVWTKSNFIISSINSIKICGDNFVTRVSERKEDKPTQYYRYFIKYNYETGNIIFNSKEYQTNLDYCYVFSVDNCNKLIIDRDYDYRAGIIACYNYNTLNIESHTYNLNHFNKNENTIKFRSHEFIGQIANIKIYNSSGAIIETLFNGVLNQSNYYYQIPELPNGAYYVLCQLPNQSLNFNFMVVR